ncbi:hypothetical protein HanIR_Chr13g0622431 [Helianthus annuus]|nr:hypothetical protein HanIR_Chr13g0622431 [Helianthus annuus]
MKTEKGKTLGRANQARGHVKLLFSSIKGGARLICKPSLGKPLISHCHHSTITISPSSTTFIPHPS